MDMYSFWKNLNPNHKTKEVITIEKFFDKVNDKAKNNKKVILEKLIKNKDFQKRVFRKLHDKCYN